MTDEQIEVVAGICDDNKRVYVSGVAGSGKTQIAYDRAINYASSGLRTLFVCYNRCLAEHLQDRLRKDPDSGTGLTIVHFHGLARMLIEVAGVEWAPPEAGPLLAEFFVNEVPDLMEQAIYLAMEDGNEVQFDAIVIDEAQDFHARWWEVLQCALLKGGANGALLAFADPVQKVWDWAPSEPPVSFAARYSLRRNCRNSKWIARTSTALANTEAKYFRRAPLGGKPKVFTVSSMPSMKGIVMKVVEQLIQEHGLRPSQVVLIGPKNYENGSLRDVRQIAGVSLTSDVRVWLGGDALLVTTSRSFKGLEADAVVLYDLERLSEGFSIIDLYIACTRARSHVQFLVAGKEMHAEIEEVIERVQQELGK
jgi:superfamily I DNA and RNA helicase